MAIQYLNNTDASFKCYHCGDFCKDDSIKIDEKVFCCNGCRTVYQILNENQLCNYYAIGETPGISLKNPIVTKFDYLDEEKIVDQIIDFKDENTTAVSFYIPQMHCSSCIWLLENLYNLNNAVSFSRVNFLKKILSVRFNNKQLSLKELVKLLSSIGYEPQIKLDSAEKKQDSSSAKKLYYKIGIAAFCFGNIMLLSFPEYLNINVSEVFYRKVFGYLNLLLSLPVFFYSASEYFLSAWGGLKKKIINIDFPISLGILVLFSRSVYEIFTFTGSGYFDSLTGLIFFLLIGKLFQEKTYESLNFERNYKSYFPLAVTVKKDKKEKSIPVADLKIGDRIIIRKHEIIPADSILFNGNGLIDYSFVTGESHPVEKVSGEMIFAGGRQTGAAIEVEVVKEVSQSYLTRLWNNDSFQKRNQSSFTSFSNSVSKYFTIVILLIASGAGLYWFPDTAKALNVFTAVLIVACPCALALSIPFTLGNSLRIFGRNKFYLKNTGAIEEMAKIDSIVFDKTGTITELDNSRIEFIGAELNDFQKEVIKSLVKNSTHPLSKIIYDNLNGENNFDVVNFDEINGEGIQGRIFDKEIRLGSVKFISQNVDTDIFNNYSEESFSSKFDTKVYLSINKEVLGYFKISNSYRKGIESLIPELNSQYNLMLLSGDNEGEKSNLLKFFDDENQLHFKQTPDDKLNFIKNLQALNKKVMMIGDGLNDAGALSQSNFGVSVTDNISNFSPACDAILEASMLKRIKKFLHFSRISINIIYASFIISFVYNLVGLSFAVEGLLSPIVAAILMPISSISVVVFATLATNFAARRNGL